jgi:predicted nucleic acid-binding protein
VRALLDTSVLIEDGVGSDVEGAISVASLAELHFGVLMESDDDEERARRIQRLGVVEATFEVLPADAMVAREWGRLTAAVEQRGGSARRRAVDLIIAATANVHRLPLLTHNVRDFRIVDDLVDVRFPHPPSTDDA